MGIPIILIVDDVETNRFILRDIISDMGYRPVLTENGVQALKVVERIRPQLIILDVAMPEMDGYEFCRIMKGNADTREIPIIFISAFDDPSDIVKGFNLGGEDYVTKPFIPEVVKARVSLHLKLSETSRNLSEMNRKLQLSISEHLKCIEDEKRNVLCAVVRTVQENPEYNRMRMERLSYNAKTLSEAMQLSPQYGNRISDSYIEIMELAAKLCEIGNIGLLQDIKEIENDSDFIQMTLEIVESYRENWDGSGFPNGWKGAEIPLCAQIIAVAYTYCVLTEKNSSGDVLQLMEKDAGKKFNPDIFAILKKVHRQLH